MLILAIYDLIIQFKSCILYKAAFGFMSTFAVDNKRSHRLLDDFLDCFSLIICIKIPYSAGAGSAGASPPSEAPSPEGAASPSGAASAPDDSPPEDSACGIST